jgi:hypothetical protein
MQPEQPRRGSFDQRCSKHLLQGESQILAPRPRRYYKTRALRRFKGTLIGDDGGRLLAGTVDRKISLPQERNDVVVAKGTARGHKVCKAESVPRG